MMTSLTPTGSLPWMKFLLAEGSSMLLGMASAMLFSHLLSLKKGTWQRKPVPHPRSSHWNSRAPKLGLRPWPGLSAVKLTYGTLFLIRAQALLLTFQLWAMGWRSPRPRAPSPAGSARNGGSSHRCYAAWLEGQRGQLGLLSVEHLLKGREGELLFSPVSPLLPHFHPGNWEQIKMMKAFKIICKWE